MAGNEIVQATAVMQGEAMDVPDQFAQVQKYITQLRHPEGDHRQEVTREHSIYFEDELRRILFISPFTNAANVSVEYPEDESHQYALDTNRLTMRRVVWSQSQIISSEVLFREGDAFVAKKEYPDAPVEQLPVAEAAKLLSRVRLALGGLQRALA